VARHPSALKRHRQSLKRRARNAARRSNIRTRVRKVRESIEKKDSAAAREQLKQAVSSLMRARGKGVLHKRTAARRIARLSRAVHRLAGPKA
jgi:small subunit ribosomal protein S20